MIRAAVLFLVGSSTLLFLRRWRPLLVVSSLTVMAGSSFHQGLKEAAANPRFLMYAVLIAVLLLMTTTSRFPSALFVPFALLVVLAAASATWAGAFAVTALERAAGLGLLFGVGAVALRRRWGSEEVIEGDLATLAGVAAATVISSFVLVVLHRPSAYYDFIQTGGTRLSGVLENPNTLGLLGALYVPVFLGFCLRRHPIRWGLFALLAVIGVGLGQSRGALLSLVAGLAFFTLARQKGERRRQVAFMALIGCILLPLALLVARSPADLAVFQRIDAQSAGSGRLQVWGIALDTWLERPVSGWGFGSTEDVFAPRVAHLAETATFVGRHPHNTWLMALIEIGPVGLTLLIVAVLVAVTSTVGAGHSPLRAGVIGAIGAGLTVSLFEAGLTSPGSVLGFNFWMIAFLGMALRHVPASESEPKNSDQLGDPLRAPRVLEATT